MELRRPRNLPRDELINAAGEALAIFKAKGVDAFVNFKFTCERCGTRCAFSEPNTLREYGECCECGHVTKVVAGGFMLTANLAQIRKEKP